MKKAIHFIMQIKTFAALLFAGMICLYMVGGAFVAYALHQPFAFAIPFIFILEGLVLSVLISILWGVFFSGLYVKQWRYFPRLVVFSSLLLLIFAMCFLVFFAIHTNWAKLWWIVAAGIEAGVIALSIVAELYYKTTGKRYTEILQAYKADR